MSRPSLFLLCLSSSLLAVVAPPGDSRWMARYYEMREASAYWDKFVDNFLSDFKESIEPSGYSLRLPDQHGYFEYDLYFFIVWGEVWVYDSAIFNLYFLQRFRNCEVEAKENDEFTVTVYLGISNVYAKTTCYATLMGWGPTFYITGTYDEILSVGEIRITPDPNNVAYIESFKILHMKGFRVEVTGVPGLNWIIELAMYLLEYFYNSWIVDVLGQIIKDLASRMLEQVTAFLNS